MVYAMAWVDKIGILDLNHPEESFSVTTRKKVPGDLDYCKSVLKKDINKVPVHNLFPVVTNDRIYILHKNNDNGVDTPKSIQVFDWDGNYIARYDIEEQISSFVLVMMGRHYMGTVTPKRHSISIILINKHLSL